VGNKALEKGHKLLECARMPRAGLFNLVLQGLHLNTAVLGYCVLPVTKSELAAHLGALEEARGLDFMGLKFIHLDECTKVVEDFEQAIASGEPATEWHGTAVMRLQLAAKHRKTIDDAIATMQQS
jgi:hypothetical protein